MSSGGASSGPSTTSGRISHRTQADRRDQTRAALLESAARLRTYDDRYAAQVAAGVLGLDPSEER